MILYPWGGKGVLKNEFLRYRATYCCIAWYISWMSYQSLLLGRAGRFWLVELSHMSSPNPASQLIAGSHSSCRLFYGKECCRKASILIWNGREERVRFTGGWNRRNKPLVVYFKNLNTRNHKVKLHTRWSFKCKPYQELSFCSLENENF